MANRDGKHRPLPLPTCYTFLMRRLIVNADDFGLTHGVNRAIIACHQHGIVSSTTLMSTAACFDEAVAMAAAETPPLSVGCHIVLVDGAPLLPPNDVRSLLAPGTHRFYQTIGEVLWAVARGRFRAEEVEAEAWAQFARLQRSNVEVSHFDAHKHVHMFPSILKPLLRAAMAHGIMAVRNPFEAPGVVTFHEAREKRTLLIRKAETTLLRGLLRQRWLHAVHHAGFSTPDGSLGVATTGTLDRASLRAMLQKMPQGTWELVCHPGYNDSDLAAAHTKLRESREVELATLLGITARELSEEYGTELVPYRAIRPLSSGHHLPLVNPI